MSSDTDLISRIIALTTCGTHISINEHRDVSETVAEYLDFGTVAGVNVSHNRPCIDPDVRRVMAETDTIVEITCYTETPGAAIVIYHYDLIAALTQMLQTLEGNADA